MENIVNSVCLSVLVILEIAVYLSIIGSLAPKLFLKIRYTVKESSDRGLKKYIFPSGRGVVYEPHPSIRKYIHRYALFTNDGYKYIKCRLDSGVRRLNYTVVMFNNRNKIVDVIDISETKPRGCETDAIEIHQDTSYVSLILNSVNGDKVRHKELTYCNMWGIFVYAALVALLSFAQFMFTCDMIKVFIELWSGTRPTLNFGAGDFILPSLLIGIVAGVLSYVHTRSKGIRWSK